MAPDGSAVFGVMLMTASAGTVYVNAPVAVPFVESGLVTETSTANCCGRIFCGWPIPLNGLATSVLMFVRLATTSVGESITKLAISRVCQASRELTFSILGAHGMLDGSDAPYDGSLHTVALASFGVRIGGGTDEIQRNALGERVLGLPREPATDRDVAFRDLPR